MKKKLISLLLSLIVILSFSISSIYADTNNKGKVIYLSLNRTSLENLLEIPIIKEKTSNSGYVALMTTKGDGSNTDQKSFASIGSGVRANVLDEDYVKFETLNENEKTQFEAATGVKSWAIGNIKINRNINQNTDNGGYGATLGMLGTTLNKNNLKVALLGNSDIKKNDDLKKIRNLALVCMDENGRVQSGNVDNINKKDDTMPFGISTDYDKLKSETKKYYENNDAIFVELGDTYRLDEYKNNLNENTYKSMKKKIYQNINDYLKEVFEMAGKNDTIYIVSEFESNLDYKTKRRLSPVIKFEKDGYGLLESSTTRNSGIVSNIDIGVDIINKFGLKNELMIGKVFKNVQDENGIKKVLKDYERIVSINTIRASVVNSYVGIVSASWVIAMIAILFKNKIPKKEKGLGRDQIFKVLKELIKLGLIMPLAFLTAPVFQFKTPAGLVSGVLIVTIIYYLIGYLLFRKDDIKQMGFYAFLTIGLIIIDCVIGTPLMKSGIMSYDAINGARYYGVGNEYEGVTIASAVFALAVLLNYKKISKWLAVVLSLVILITSAMPSMGANVGGAISECVAYLLFILLIFDVKLDLKKIIMIGVATVLIVVAFAGLDFLMGTESHLAVFTNQIIQEGPAAIFYTFGRKIQMNLKLAKSSVWVNILIVSIIIIGALIFKPSGYFKKIHDKYPMIFKGFMASFVGCIVTLLVNDSGIVAASTAAIYILIPIIIIGINMIIFDKEID
ncbi:hypothetical protein SAMN02745147_1121 [Intestinibacter bartlettii DSM 16795]|uniref:hypothetical protein n=1 Tax=Intestinibacter bartlettii TaxID=261299 RepID=UPI0001631842|nr:hypothetical protein [Intestinibacter bartlettii]EDQ96416.1 hypothetical protein CLOBAR_02183 [Intestinibacter bartlettii DSM 16795]UWO82166.1 hypothetical protein NQ514_06660 [Intestinibacter bartlettii]SKA52920.1 hypothetical protein SAMN02745147_1121 [Intestinibacter bartlettii DSM 16795]